MPSSVRRFALFAFVLLGLAQGAWADAIQFSATKYATDSSLWGIGQYQDVTGGSPSISPSSGYVYSAPDPILPLPTEVSLTFNYPGHYAAKWALVKQGTLLPHLSVIEGNLYGLTLSYAQLSKLSGASQGIDVVPLFAEMSYTLKYHAGTGGTFVAGKQPAEATYQWSASVTAASANLCTRTGYTQVGWRPNNAGTGALITCGQSMTGATYPVTEHEQVVTLYAQWQVNQYPLHLKVGTGIDKIYYQINGATSWSSVSATTDVQVDYDSTWKVYATPKAGYSYTDTTEGNPRTGRMTTDGATFEPSGSAGSISVSFNGNGSTSGSMSSKAFTVDSGDYLPANGFSRGYEVSFDARGGSACPSLTATYPFRNWNDKADGTGPFTYSDQQMVTNPCNSTGDAVMLYAQWDTSSVTPITLPTTTWAGHTFSGWYADQGCTVKVGDAGASYTPTDRVTLYAGWGTVTYTVTFRDGHRDAGDAVIGTPQQVVYGGAATPPTPPVHKYSEFLKWDSEAYRQVTGDVTIRAQYADKVYQIYYQSNYQNGQAEGDPRSGGTCGPGQGQDQEIVLRTAKWASYDKVGHHFLGWDWDANAVTPKWMAGEEMAYWEIDEHPDSNLYAIWAPNRYKVHFIGGEGVSGSMPDQEFDYGVPQALSANKFTRTDEQTFLRWTDGSRTYADSEVVSNLTATADGIVTLTAVWSNYHYVRFDRNGATNETEMALQKLSGGEATNLTANAYGRVGYTYAGWATNLADAAACRVAYTNCQSVSFPSAQPNETNVLYAVWTTNRYMIVFDPGTNGVWGTMEPLTNCAYDTALTITCGYTNYCSLGLLGWSRAPGAIPVDYPVRTSEMPVVTQGRDAIVSNLTAVADGQVTLYAVWDGIGELSRAAGLTNAVLYSECEEGNVKVLWRAVENYTEEPGHPDCVALMSPTEEEETGKWNLKMTVRNAGRLSYCWYWEQYGPVDTTFRVYVDRKLQDSLEGGYWTQTNRLSVAGEGVHEICWEIDGTINDGSMFADKICLDDITWTPEGGVEVTPGGEMPTYASEGEAEAAAKTVRVARPNDAVKGVIGEADYAEMFTVSAVPAATPGEWTLAVELKPMVSNEVQAAVNAATAELVDTMAGDGPISVGLSMMAGIYYGLAATNELPWLHLAAPTEWVLGTGVGKQTLSVDRPAGAAGFFRIHATPVPPNVVK